MAKKHSLMNPGKRAPDSGQYGIVRHGARIGVERTVTRGEPLPPPPRRGDKYVLVDKTKH